MEQKGKHSSSSTSKPSASSSSRHVYQYHTRFTSPPLRRPGPGNPGDTCSPYPVSIIPPRLGAPTGPSCCGEELTKIFRTRLSTPLPARKRPRRTCGSGGGGGDESPSLQQSSRLQIEMCRNRKYNETNFMLVPCRVFFFILFGF